MHVTLWWEANLIQSLFLERNIIVAQPQSVIRKLSTKYEKITPTTNHREIIKTTSQVVGLTSV